MASSFEPIIPLLPPPPPSSFSFSSPQNMNDSNPYFLYYGDSPGTILVSQPLLRENYTTWSRSMIMALSAKNKVSFIDGSIV